MTEIKIENGCWWRWDKKFVNEKEPKTLLQNSSAMHCNIKH